MTLYVVLQQQPDGAYQLIGDPVDTPGSSGDAIKAVIEGKGLTDGVYASVPLRSWAPARYRPKVSWSVEPVVTPGQMQIAPPEAPAAAPAAEEQPVGVPVTDVADVVADEPASTAETEQLDDQYAQLLQPPPVPQDVPVAASANGADDDLVLDAPAT